jgi:hypothetical protein
MIYISSTAGGGMNGAEMEQLVSEILDNAAMVEMPIDTTSACKTMYYRFLISSSMSRYSG